MGSSTNFKSSSWVSIALARIKTFTDILCSNNATQTHNCGVHRAEGLIMHIFREQCRQLGVFSVSQDLYTAYSPIYRLSDGVVRFKEPCRWYLCCRYKGWISVRLMTTWGIKCMYGPHHLYLSTGAGSTAFEHQAVSHQIATQSALCGREIPPPGIINLTVT